MELLLAADTDVALLLVSEFEPLLNNVDDCATLGKLELLNLTGSAMLGMILDVLSGSADVVDAKASGAALLDMRPLLLEDWRVGVPLAVLSG